MKTIEIKVYEFDELGAEAQEKAIEKFADINVDYEWWDCIYDDAKIVGIKIIGFNIDRGSYCKGKFEHSPEETAKLILEQHGESCETYKTAKEFLDDWDKLVVKYSDGITVSKVSEENEFEFDKEAEELEEEFTKSIFEDYRIILSKEYEYKTNREAIIETIKANEYLFTEDGKHF